MPRKIEKEMPKIDRSHISNTMHWLGLVTAVSFIFLGIFILYSPNLDALESTMRTLFSVFFFSLGIFRVVNWVLKNKSRNQERSSNEN